MFKGPFVRSAYNYDMDEVSEATGLRCLDKSLTQQEFAEECDINVIVKRAGLTGELPEGVMVPFNADFEGGVVDFKSAMNLLVSANNAFMEMPAEVRSRFMNDPARFIDFVSDESNRDEARKLGLLVPPAPVSTGSVASKSSSAPGEAPKPDTGASTA